MSALVPERGAGEAAEVVQFRRRGAAVAMGVALVALGALGAGTAPASTSRQTSTPEVEHFTTPGTFAFTVPVNVTSLSVEVCGAQGGTAGGVNVEPSAPGLGGLGPAHDRDGRRPPRRGAERHRW